MEKVKRSKGKLLKGIMSNVSGSVPPIIMQKNGVIRSVKNTPKRKIKNKG